MHERNTDPVLADPWLQPDLLRSLSVPEAFFWVIERPTPLAGMRDPRWSGLDWTELSSHGFRSVVCLSASPPGYDPSPLRTAWCGELEDLAGNSPPEDPVTELQLIEEATDAVIDELAAGRGVVVHCLEGIGRTGTVLAASLIQLGFDPNLSIEHVTALNAVRGHHWPEADWHLEAIRVNILTEHVIL